MLFDGVLGLAFQFGYRGPGTLSTRISLPSCLRMRTVTDSAAFAWRFL